LQLSSQYRFQNLAGAIRYADHAAVLLAGRLCQLKDDDLKPDGVVKRGVSSTIVRCGGGLQLRF
jgi:hypothetical protein